MKFSFAALLVLISVSSDFAQTEPDPRLVQAALDNFSAAQGSKLYSGSSLPVFSHHEETKGSRYLFDDWAKGVVVSANNAMIDNVNFFFNYDKINNHLFITQDKKTVIEVDKEEFKAFTLRHDGKEFVYKHMPLFDNSSFFQELLTSEEKYSLYKLTRTKFLKSNFHTDGIVETGNPYDEFVDEHQYFVVFPGAKLYKPISLKRKSITDVLSMEKDKVNLYFSQHKGSNIDEAFLIGLVTSFD